MSGQKHKTFFGLARDWKWPYLPYQDTSAHLSEWLSRGLVPASAYSGHSCWHNIHFLPRARKRLTTSQLHWTGPACIQQIHQYRQRANIKNFPTSHTCHLFTNCSFSWPLTNWLYISWSVVSTRAYQINECHTSIQPINITSPSTPLEWKW